MGLGTIGRIILWRAVGLRLSLKKSCHADKTGPVSTYTEDQVCTMSPSFDILYFS